jgi:N-glycosylase/DNA lyase
VQGRIAIKELLARQGDVFNRREWLVRHVKGMGYKEASHFLRNTGDGARLAILDRHILKNLEILGVTGSIPGSLTRNRYLEIEDSMREFSAAIGIPMDHLDFVLWFKEAGSVFK